MEKKLILHRGYKGKYPENSEKSFYYAIKQNLPFETDIRISKDNKVYLIHDEEIDRLFNGKGEIKKLISKELEKFRYKEDSTQKLFSLENLCKLVKNKGYDNLIFIHIKENKDIGSTIKVIEKYGLKENIGFFAVDEIEEEFKKIMGKKYPEYKKGLYFSDHSSLDEEQIVKSDFIWADEKTDKLNITGEIIKCSHALGKKIYAISPELIPESFFNKNIPKRWKELIHDGIDGICTDFPEKFLKINSSS